MTNDKSPRTLSTVENSMNIIEKLKDNGPISITKLSNEMGMSKGAVYTHLATLNKKGYVIKDGDKYKLSHKFLDVGSENRFRSGLLKSSYDPMKNLANETGEVVQLMVEEFGKGVNIHKEYGSKIGFDDWLTKKLGKSAPLHINAPGKAILANLPSEQRENIIDNSDLRQSTENTIVDINDLKKELEEIREQGYSINDQEEDYGIRAVASPIIIPEDELLGAVSVAAPTSRMPEERFTSDLPEKVVKITNIIEIRYSVDEENSR